MEENKNQLPATLQVAPQQVTKPLIQSLFNTELVRRNYRKILQAAVEIKPTRNNLKDAYNRLKDLEAFAKEMESYRKTVSDPYFKAQKDIKATFDEIMQPILTEVDSLKAAIKTVNDELSAELAAAAIEKNRVIKIADAMTNFINNTTRQIAEAKNDEELVGIQKRIGSEKSRSAFYMEFMDDFRGKCDALTPLINQRKETIRKGFQLLNEQKEALASGNIELASDIRDELELLDVRMEENVLRIQQTAYEQAASTEVIVADPIIDTIKGRQMWKWKVDDIATLYKKMPHLVQLVPNKEAIEAVLSENKKEWNEKGEDSITMNGLTFYKQKNI